MAVGAAWVERRHSNIGQLRGAMTRPGRGWVGGWVGSEVSWRGVVLAWRERSGCSRHALQWEGQEEGACVGRQAAGRKLQWLQLAVQRLGGLRPVLLLLLHPAGRT